MVGERWQGDGLVRRMRKSVETRREEVDRSGRWRGMQV